MTGARDVLMRGIAMNCSDITSLYHAWGLLEIKDHRRAEAGDIFRRGVELGLKGNREVENGVGFLLHSLGMLELDSHRVEEAKRVFSTGVSLFPQHSQMLLGRSKPRDHPTMTPEEFQDAVAKLPLFRPRVPT